MSLIGRGLPVDILGGYLGAGKTTLLNRLLTTVHGRRFGVLVNDFGAINIDAKWIRASDAEVVSLANGCACCTVANDLGRALARIADPALGIEQVLIEASGVADPMKLAQTVLAWPGLELGRVLIVADACNVARLSDDRFVGKLVRRQLSTADLIVVSKLDVLDAATGAKATSWLEEIAPQCAVVPATAWDTLLRTWRQSTVAPRRWLSGSLAPIEHENLFSSFSFSMPATIDIEGLRMMLGELPASVVRAKGMVTAHGPEARAFLLQLTGRQWTLTPTDEFGVSKTEVVFCWIGPERLAPTLERALNRMCRATDAQETESARSD